MSTIRRATINDIETLRHLNNEVFIDNQKYDDDLVMDWALSDLGKAYFTKLFNNPDAVCFIAEEEGKAVGYIACKKMSLDYRKSKYLEIDHMGVVPQYRSKGIGTLLIQTIEKWAKENGYQKFYVNAYFHNTKALAFYRRNGFVEIDVSLEQKL